MYYIAFNFLCTFRFFISVQLPLIWQNILEETLRKKGTGMSKEFYNGAHTQKTGSASVIITIAI